MFRGDGVKMWIRRRGRTHVEGNLRCMKVEASLNADTWEVTEVVIT